MSSVITSDDRAYDPQPSTVGRLRLSPTGTRRVTHPRARTPAFRSTDHHRPALAQHQRLRPDRNAGLLGLRIFDASGANIDNLGEEHGHRVFKIRDKGDKAVLIPLPLQCPSNRPSRRRS